MKAQRIVGVGLALFCATFGASCDVTPCTPENCAGCCDDRQTCHIGDESSACGAAGSACIDCGGDVCKLDGRCFGSYSPAPRDGGPDDLLPDANFTDAGIVDGGPEDAGLVDAGTPDAGELDGGLEDAGVSDAGEVDAGEDAGLLDAGVPDSGVSDSGVTDSGVPDAGVTDAGFDAGVLDAGPRGLYVSPTGSDSNDGTRATPFRTLAHAASVAQAGEVIIPLAGVYDATTQPAFGQFNNVGVRIPDGVSVLPEAPGQVTFRGLQGMGIDFLGSGNIGAIRMEDLTISVRFRRGVGTVVGVDFSGCGVGGGGDQSCVEVRGDAGVTLSPLPGGNPDYFHATSYALAGSYESGQLTIRGGRLSGARDTGISGNAAIRAADLSRLVIEDLIMEGNTTPIGIATSGGAQVTITRLTANGTTGWFLGAYGGSNVTLRDSTITGFDNAVVVPPNTGSTARVTLDNVRVGWSRVFGIFSGYGTSPRLELVNSQIVDAGANAINLGGDFGVTALIMRGSVVTGAPQHAIQLVNGSTPFRLEVRNSTVTRNGQIGFYLAGAANSVFDLGTGSDAGNNAIFDNVLTGSAGHANLRFDGPAGTTALASGNRWQPFVQGANSQGRFAATDGGSAVTLTGRVTGTNVYIETVGATVRLAE